MTAITANLGRLDARLESVFGAIRSMLVRRWAYMTTLAELQAMSDRDLADIGFVRSDLRRIARESAEDRS